MIHDLAAAPDGEDAERFRKWLETETTAMLQRSYGDLEGTKSAIFLFCNRAYEAHMPESEIGEMFGSCIVRAGFKEHEEEACISWLEHFAQVASNVHGKT